MVYKNIKKVNYNDIIRYSNIYEFPNDDKLINLFYEINGGKPVGFYFYVNICGDMQEDSISTILSFNENDDENIYEATLSVIENEREIIPIALDKDGNYICYVNDNGDCSIQLYNIEEMEFYDVYAEKNIRYTPDMFFEDLKE